MQSKRLTLAPDGKNSTNYIIDHEKYSVYSINQLLYHSINPHMKIIKFIMLLWICIIPYSFLSAQRTDAFSSMGTSLSVTTTGFELELATPIHERVVLRGGVSLFPYTFDANIDVRQFNSLEVSTINIDMEGKIKLVNGKVLLDFYPGMNSSFSISGGLYFGKKDLIRIEGFSDTDLYWGDHTLYTENGRVKASVEANSIKPYIGIGFGNTIPNRRVGFRFELGAMFHGTPALYNSKGEELDDVNINGTDVIDTINKIKVYPVVAFRLTGRIF